MTQADPVPDKGSELVPFDILRTVVEPNDGIHRADIVVDCPAQGLGYDRSMSLKAGLNSPAFAITGKMKNGGRHSESDTQRKADGVRPMGPDRAWLRNADKHEGRKYEYTDGVTDSPRRPGQ